MVVGLCFEIHTLELNPCPASFSTKTLKFYKMPYCLSVVFNQMSVDFQHKNEIGTEIKEVINFYFFYSHISRCVHSFLYESMCPSVRWSILLNVIKSLEKSRYCFLTANNLQISFEHPAKDLL